MNNKAHVDDTNLLLQAVALAARAHRHQVRKDRETPYVSHVFRVCVIARHLFGVDDPRVLTAAVLHDTIEDTTTDFDDLADRFGQEIAGWVAALTKDKRLDDEARERAYEEKLRHAPWQVKVCKLADVYDNLTDAVHLTQAQRGRTGARARRYLAAVATDAPEFLAGPIQIVSELLETMASSGTPGR